MNETITSSPETTTSHQPAPRDLRRDSSDKMLAGVASGLARYLDADVTLVRIVFAVLSIVGGVGVPLYLVIPEDGAAESLASEYLHRWQDRSR
jgi:phage shock protein PspC (stress-responsive transcriptional regulator)